MGRAYLQGIPAVKTLEQLPRLKNLHGQPDTR